MPSPRPHGSALQKGAGDSDTKQGQSQTSGEHSVHHTNESVFHTPLSRFWTAEEDTKIRRLHVYPDLTSCPG